MKQLTEKELKYIIIILRIHKESYQDFLRGFGDKSKIDIFLEDLIKKLESESQKDTGKIN